MQQVIKNHHLISKTGDFYTVGPGAIGMTEDEVNRKKIFIGNLPKYCTSMELFNLFRRYGEILESVAIPNDAKTQCRGYGFVTFKDINDTHFVLNHNVPILFDNIKLIINTAKPTNKNKRYFYGVNGTKNGELEVDENDSEKSNLILNNIEINKPMKEKDIGSSSPSSISTTSSSASTPSLTPTPTPTSTYTSSTNCINSGTFPLTPVTTNSPTIPVLTPSPSPSIATPTSAGVTNATTPIEYDSLPHEYDSSNIFSGSDYSMKSEIRQNNSYESNGNYNTKFNFKIKQNNFVKSDPFFEIIKDDKKTKDLMKKQKERFINQYLTRDILEIDIRFTKPFPLNEMLSHFDSVNTAKSS